MNEIVKNLQELARLAERNGGAGEMEVCLKGARSAIRKSADPQLTILDGELETWQAKLAVILREPAGRNGMAHHCRYWIEKLKVVQK